MTELNPNEVADLAEFVSWVRKCWKAGGNPESRRAWENSLREAHAGHVNEVMWKVQHDQLAARTDASVQQARREVADQLRTLARVRTLALSAGNRKTVSAEHLRIILNKCEVCSQRDAARLVRGRPTCDVCRPESDALATGPADVVRLPVEPPF